MPKTQKPKSKFKFDEIFIVFVVILLASAVSIYNKARGPKTAEAEKLTELILDNHGASFASGGVIDENKLKEIQNMDYQSLKKSLNAKNDFCVYIEDGNGNIILAKGSNNLNKDGMECRE